MSIPVQSQILVAIATSIGGFVFSQFDIADPAWTRASVTLPWLYQSEAVPPPALRWRIYRAASLCCNSFDHASTFLQLRPTYVLSAITTSHMKYSGITQRAASMANATIKASGIKKIALSERPRGEQHSQFKTTRLYAVHG